MLNEVVEFLLKIPFLKSYPQLIPIIFVIILILLGILSYKFYRSKQYIKFSAAILIFSFTISQIIYLLIRLKNK
jgi:tryptophan-rich sensory protein